MDAFDQLIEVSDRLNSPDGCPWDIEQTFQTLRPYVLEEAHEVLEAVDENNDKHLIEELGDLFYTVIFYAKVAERENRFTLKDIIEHLKNKLIHRHPHVFGEKRASRKMEDVVNNWEEIKKKEKKERKSPIDGIPKTLPLLQRASKVLESMKKHGCPLKSVDVRDRQEELAQEILSTVVCAVEEEIDIESSFRVLLSTQEGHFKLHPSET